MQAANVVMCRAALKIPGEPRKHMLMRRFFPLLVCSMPVLVGADMPEEFKERLGQEQTATLQRVPPRAGRSVIGMMQSFLREEREALGNDHAFTSVVLEALRKAKDDELIEPVVLTELKSLECTRSLCELVMDAAYLANPDAVADTVGNALTAQDARFTRVQSEPDGALLHVFVIRPDFARSVQNGD